MRPGRCVLRLLASACLLLGGCAGSHWLTSRPAENTYAGSAADPADDLNQPPGHETASKAAEATTPSTAEKSSTGAADEVVAADGATASDPLLQRLETLRQEDPQLYADLQAALSTAEPAMRATLARQFEAQLSARTSEQSDAGQDDASGTATGVRQASATEVPDPMESSSPEPPAGNDAGVQASDPVRATISDYSPWYSDQAHGATPRMIVNPFVEDDAPQPHTVVASRPDEDAASRDPMRSPASDAARNDPRQAIGPNATWNDSSSDVPPRGESQSAGRADGDAEENWRTLLDRTIAAVEDQLRPPAPPNVDSGSGAAPGASGTASSTDSAVDPAATRLSSGERLSADDRARLETQLRLLYLAAGRGDDAVKPVSQWDPPLQEYWKNQLHGLSVALDSRGMPLLDRRAALALRHLREAESHLAAASTLDLRNLTFCTRVDSFGRYTQFDRYEFQADQEVLLYVEIDNFSVKSNPQGHETALTGSYQVFDTSGRRVADHTFPTEREVCRNRRRDFFIPYRVYMPKSIAPGKYTLQLTVEDAHAEKFGQGSIEFTIKN